MIETFEVTQILTGLHDSDSSKRNDFIEKLIKLQNPAVVDSLIELLREEKTPWIIKEGACKVLGKIGDKKATAALIATLNDENEIVRYQAVNALGKLRAKSAVPKLTAIIQRKEEELVRSEAMKALGLIGDPSTMKIILSILKKENDRFLRYHSVTSLGKIGDKRALKELQKIVKEGKDERLVARAMEAIDAIEKRLKKEKVVAR